MVHGDILIYAIVAVVLLARLWTVFGRRNDEDQQRPNPFATPAPGLRDEKNVSRAEVPRVPDNAQPAFAPLTVAPMSLAGALERVKQLDPAFDEKQFLKDARTIFTSVIGAFAKGDLAAVERKLAPPVLESIRKAIEARTKAGETLESHLVRINEAETVSAKAEEDKIVIGVRVVSEQENILRDAGGNIVSGKPGEAEEVTDVWIFARPIKPAGADWQIIETRS